MNAALRRCATPIHEVLVYVGHEQHPLLGPYLDSVQRNIAMFTQLNMLRKQHHLRPWEVTTFPGERLIEVLKRKDPKEVMIAIPAGESTRLDKVFSLEQTICLKGFFEEGGRGYFTCGSAYWGSGRRVYKGLCEETPEKSQLIVKPSTLSLFQGIAEGPLCPYPGKQYNVDFYSDSVTVSAGERTCNVLLSGGGSFIPDSSVQKVRVLARYLHDDLIRYGKIKEECKKWENAAIMTSIGKGAAILSMFHPYYDPDTIDVEAYEKAFPDCGTNWKEVKQKLSASDDRMQFVFYEMLTKLEVMNLDLNP
ncbi:MAG: hypothetical protein HY860_01790 [Chlamydiales bacterium]|nr:hypothetical protein [Chlamydiales bacterium]